MSKNKEVKEDPIETAQSAASFIKEVRHQINTIKPQVELMELKARFSEASYKNLEFIMRLESIRTPQPENSFKDPRIANTNESEEPSVDRTPDESESEVSSENHLQSVGTEILTD